jgi:hypothetical protein
MNPGTIGRLIERVLDGLLRVGDQRTPCPQSSLLTHDAQRTRRTRSSGTESPQAWQQEQLRQKPAADDTTLDAYHRALGNTTPEEEPEHAVRTQNRTWLD